MMHDVVPVESDAGLEKQAIGNCPAIFGIGGDLRVVLLDKRRLREGRVARTGELRVLSGCEAKISGCQSVVGDHIRDRLTEEMSVVSDVVEIDSDLEVVASVPALWRQINIRETLPACGDGFRAQI